nr:hypothetical protein HK105_005446 [Polyrhizophydium stewartii]
MPELRRLGSGMPVTALSIHQHFSRTSLEPARPARKAGPRDFPSMPAPLLNEYKATFAARRYVATLSGGPALPPPDSPLSNAALAVVFGIITLAFPAIAAAVVLVTVGDAPLGSAANTAYGGSIYAPSIGATTIVRGCDMLRDAAAAAAPAHPLPN